MEPPPPPKSPSPAVNDAEKPAPIKKSLSSNSPKCTSPTIGNSAPSEDPAAVLNESPAKGYADNPKEGPRPPSNPKVAFKQTVVYLTSKTVIIILSLSRITHENDSHNN